MIFKLFTQTKPIGNKHMTNLNQDLVNAENDLIPFNYRYQMTKRDIINGWNSFVTTYGIEVKTPIEEILKLNERFALGELRKRRYPLLQFKFVGNSPRFNRGDFERWRLALAIFLLENKLATETT